MTLDLQADDGAPGRRGAERGWDIVYHPLILHSGRDVEYISVTSYQSLIVEYPPSLRCSPLRHDESGETEEA